ncbi:MAG: hypothetical protein QF464_05210, partial [Myxococcota bacterium]|nr:hypothetical protein [Myxococcota bacterium]
MVASGPSPWVVIALAAGVAACGGPRTPSGDTATPAQDGAVTHTQDGSGGEGVSGGEDIGDATPLPALVFPPDLSGGFVDLTEALETWPPFAVHPGSVDEGQSPDVPYGVFAVLETGGASEVILSNLSRDYIFRQIYTYDPDTGALTPRATDPLPAGGVSFVADLDGDGHPDALMSGEFGFVVTWGDDQNPYAVMNPLVVGQNIGYDERS